MQFILTRAATSFITPRLNMKTHGAAAREAAFDVPLKCMQRIVFGWVGGR